MTIQLEITPETLKELHYQRYHHPAPLVQRRMEALWLKGHGLPPAQVAELVGVTDNTIRDYFELYQEGGVEKLKELNYYRPESVLNSHITSLEAHFRDNPPARIKEAQCEIEALTGVKRSETQVAEFLKKNSISVVEKSARFRQKLTLKRRLST
jgi:transposase